MSPAEAAASAPAVPLDRWLRSMILGVTPLHRNGPSVLWLQGVVGGQELVGIIEGVAFFGGAACEWTRSSSTGPLADRCRNSGLYDPTLSDVIRRSISVR